MTDDKALTRAKTRALRYIALRPRSRAELVSYLERKEVPEAVAGAVVEALEGFGYIDDRKFAQGYARRLVGEKGLSRYAVRFELARKGLSEEDTDAALDEVYGEGGEDEEAVALRVAQKKTLSLKGVEPEKARRRLMDHLRRRGFSFGIIARTLKQMGPL